MITYRTVLQIKDNNDMDVSRLIITYHKTKMTSEERNALKKYGLTILMHKNIKEKI